MSVDDSPGQAPIDRAVLEQLRSQFIRSQMFHSAEIRSDRNLHLRVELSQRYYPGETTASFEIRWYRNDDFNVHYQETRSESVWRCRWDRHPNGHNSRSHFHPPPDASRTDAEDAQFPTDHREVFNLILDYVIERIETLWAGQ